MGTELPNIQELFAEMIRLSRKLDHGVVELAKLAKEYGEAEHQYRQVRAVARLQAPHKQVGDKEAYVDQACSAQMLRVRLAEGLRLAAVEAVRSRRQQLSALQSLVRAVTTELDLAKTGPQ